MRNVTAMRWRVVTRARRRLGAWCGGGMHPGSIAHAPGIKLLSGGLACAGSRDVVLGGAPDPEFASG